MNILQSFWYTTPRLFRSIIVSVVTLTIFMSLLRFAFYLAYNDPNAPLSSSDFWTAMWLGMRFDLRVSMVIFLALLFLGGFKWLSPFTSKWHRYLWLVYLGSFFTILLFVFIVDFGHYAYLKSRIDFTATRFLENLDISIQMVWESYPVIWINLAFIAAVAVFVFLLNKLFKHYETVPAANYHWWAGVFSLVRSLIVTLLFLGKKFPQYRFSVTAKTVRFWKATAVGLIAFFFLFVALQSKFSQYPLRWSDAAFSKHPFATQLTYNPIHYFLDTWKNGRITYDEKKVRDAYDLIADYLMIENRDKQNLSYERPVAPTHTLGNKPNVVIVIIESFAAYKTSLSGNPINPTPHFKAIADSGYYFKNFFTPSTGTARSVYTTITGIPDVELKGTSSRNPLIVNQHSVANEFKGYKKFYFLGGSASWGNIRGILSKNIEGLDLREKGAYRFDDVDVWGISDYNLFTEANDVFKEQKEPFFAIIQTSGNHRPYTIPDDHNGFTLVTDIDRATLGKYGFQSLEELNAYRFMDHSIGHFIDEVKKSGYGKNTIFAFWGDHGIDGNPQHALKADQSSMLGLGSLRVPFVIWAPGLIKEPKVFDKVASEVDTLPTLAALAGLSYTETTLGRDLFNPKYDDQRYAFTMVHKNPPKLGLVSDKYYYVRYPNGSEKLHEVTSDDPLKDHQNEHPKEAQKMHDLLNAMYETMQYMPYFNRLKK